MLVTVQVTPGKPVNGWLATFDIPAQSKALMVIGWESNSGAGCGVCG